MKLIDKDAVLAIIEKFMYGANLEADIASTGECFDEKVADAKYQLCKCIKGKINTLEVKEVQKEPASENLESVIDTYLATYFGGEKEKQEWPFLKKMAIHFAEWQKQKDSIPVSEDLEEEIGKYCSNPENFITYIDVGFKQSPIKKDDIPLIIKAIKFGALWQKQQLMKDTVDCFSVKRDVAGISLLILNSEAICGVNDGDKVKVVILKEK